MNTSNTSYSRATVSWYGRKFHGKKTASGEVYNMRKLTAAHKTLPFGTRVKIINPETHKKVIVRITDRGPFVAGRDFDLSRKAFKKISDLNKGVIKIQYKVIKK
ncbi:septal ring lytic transglycosylase RlpA family protein [Apibacter raozihei]|nr:septal ring lytic transglycosylase RlpA family protein [Apibacter raozihei]